MDDLDRCKRGHLWTKKNTSWSRQHRDPSKMFRRCLKCQNHLQRLRYRNDDNYREKEKLRCVSKYYARKNRPVIYNDDNLKLLFANG